MESSGLTLLHAKSCAHACGIQGAAYEQVRREGGRDGERGMRGCR